MIRFEPFDLLSGLKQGSLLGGALNWRAEPQLNELAEAQMLRTVWRGATQHLLLWQKGSAIWAAC